MGLGCYKLYATNTGDETKNIILTGDYKVEKREDGNYYRPKNIPLGYDMWIPNVLDLTEDEGTIDVEVIKSDIETGIWMACEDADFIGEQWIYCFKPFFKKRNDFIQIDWSKLEDDENIDTFNSLHVNTDIKMVAGDCFPITLKRK